MVLAHLRGLLTPDYPQGFRSRVRENLVLSALAREVDAEAFGKRAIVEAVCMSAVAPQHRPKLHRDALTFLQDSAQLAKLLDFDSIEARRPKLENERDVRDLIKAFSILKDTNVFEIMDKLCTVL